MMLQQNQFLQGKCRGTISRSPALAAHPVCVTTSRRQHQSIVCMQAGAGGPSAAGNPRNGMAAQPAPASDTAPTALVRRPAPQQMVYIDISQVVGKQVITRTTGRNLGTVSNMWVDPVRYEVVSLDIDDKKGVGSTRVANIPLARLTQIGDVVLVHDETVLYDAPLDGRYGYMLLTGMEVRTRSGDFLGKVRDASFSPDNGSINRITYDDFGLSFLPVNFFDTFSLPMADVLNVGVGGVIVPDEAKFRERRESAGVFAAIPSLLRSLNSGSGRVAGALTDGFRSEGGVAGYLPQGYTYEQWEQDVRRWEQETGYSYEQYTRMTGQQPQARRPTALPSPRAPQPVQPAQPQYGQQQYSAPAQQYGAYPQQPQPQQGYAQPQQYGGYAPQPQQQPQQQRGGMSDPRYRAQQAQDPRSMAPRPQQQYPAAPMGQRPQPSGPAPGQMIPQQPAMRPPQQQQPSQPVQQPAQAPVAANGAPSAPANGAPRIDEWIVRDERAKEAVMDGWQANGNAQAAAAATPGWEQYSAGGNGQSAGQPQQQPVQ